MKILGPLLAFALLAAPAIRLLGGAVRTRRTPEIWAGLFFLGAAVGIPLRIYGTSIIESDPALSATLNTVGHIFFAAASISLTIFTWRVFHPESATMRVIALTVAFLIAGSTTHTLGTGLVSVENAGSMIFTNFMRLVPIYWACVESIRYWGVMQKRMALGLADPVVTNRFALWAFWTGALSILPTLALGLRTLAYIVDAQGIEGVARPEVQAAALMVLRVVLLATAPIAVISLSLSFFPPARYLEHVRAKAAAADAAA